MKELLSVFKTGGRLTSYQFTRLKRYVLYSLAIEVSHWGAVTNRSLQHFKIS